MRRHQQDPILLAAKVVAGVAGAAAMIFVLRELPNLVRYWKMERM
jgi:hypothetical protein